FDEEFKNNPDQKNNFLQPYFNVVYAVKNKDSDVIINDDLANLGKKENKTEEDYTVLAAWYSKLGEDKKAIEYEKIISEKYPMSEYIQSKKYSEFRQLVDVNDKINFLKEFEKNYPESQYIEPMYDIITNYYRDTKDYKKAFDFLTENQNKVSTFRFYSVADRMLKEDADYDLAFQIINLGELRNREEVTSPKGEKPKYYSESEWLQDRRYMLGLTLFVEAQLLNKMGDEHNECLALSEEAVNLTRGRETDINIFYAKILVKDGEYDKAISKIGEFYKTGFSSPKMKEYLLEAYIGQKGSDAGFEDFAAKFESAGNEKLNQKLKKDLISEPAPDFTLLDVDGRKISLSELKGKVVVLDFWATWCGPCLASFPGMKKAVEIYQDDSNVKFLFVNTWERVDNVKQNAIDFIKKNNYPFHVLLDDKNEVIEKYKVSGIPTKFIIDKNSNIRFMNVGFEGSDDQLVSELSAMISMVQ
ncbi:MAG: TlpA family protein disulfide reductase, partial [Chlorobiota bacterium]